MMRHAVAASLLFGIACATGSAQAQAPLLPSGPDPWIVRQGSTCYYMAIRRADAGSIAGA